MTEDEKVYLEKTVEKLNYRRKLTNKRYLQSVLIQIFKFLTVQQSSLVKQFSL